MNIQSMLHKSNPLELKKKFDLEKFDLCGVKQWKKRKEDLNRQSDYRLMRI